MNKMTNYTELFEKRSKCLLFNATENVSDNYGWIGGNPPDYFDDKIALINTDNIRYSFLMTVKNPLNIENAISIFIPQEFSHRIENNKYPDCSIKIFEHKITDESDNPFFRNENEIEKKHYIQLIGEIDEEKIDKQSSDEFDEDEDEAFTYLIKFGGKPVLIQEEQFYYEQLHTDGYTFLFQIDENGYPDGLMKEYIFGYGALYVYGKLSDSSINNIIAGYWQN